MLRCCVGELPVQGHVIDRHFDRSFGRNRLRLPLELRVFRSVLARAPLDRVQVSGSDLRVLWTKSQFPAGALELGVEG